MAGNKGTPAAIEVEGAPQLRKAFKKLGGRSRDLTDHPRATLRRTWKIGPCSSSRDDPGPCAESIRSTKSATRAGIQAGGRGLEPYAGPIHFGWRARNIEPQPFLYDALDDRRGEIVEALR